MSSKPPKSKCYEEPFVKVLSSRIESGVTRTEIQIVKGKLSPPLAPAGLYDPNNKTDLVFELHKTISEAGNVLTFETYEKTPPSKNFVAGEFFVRQWWMPEAFDLVSNTSLEWKREKYPNDGTHTHCCITWEAISGYVEPKEGYRCGRSWITVSAYEDFILKEKYHLRKS